MKHVNPQHKSLLMGKQCVRKCFAKTVSWGSPPSKFSNLLKMLLGIVVKVLALKSRTSTVTGKTFTKVWRTNPWLGIRKQDGAPETQIASQVEIWLWLNELYFMDVYGKYNLIFIVNGGGYKQIYNISNNIL